MRNTVVHDADRDTVRLSRNFGTPDTSASSPRRVSLPKGTVALKRLNLPQGTSKLTPPINQASRVSLSVTGCTTG